MNMTFRFNKSLSWLIQLLILLQFATYLLARWRLTTTLAPKQTYWTDKRYEKWKIHYNKSLEVKPDESWRYFNWKRNQYFVRRFNAYLNIENRITGPSVLFNRPGRFRDSYYRLRLGEYADIPDIEFSKARLGLYRRNMAGTRDEIERNGVPFRMIRHLYDTKKTLPLTLDWRDFGKISDVSDQGKCSASYALTAVDAIASWYAIQRSGRLINVSAQQIVDCSRPQENYGCSGGWMHRAFEYIDHTGGIFPSDAYPWRGNERFCGAQKLSRLINKLKPLKPFAYIDSGKEADIIQALQFGPVIAIVDGSPLTFANYGYGVYAEQNDVCGNSFGQANHAVLIVGYDNTVQNLPYWIVKNSWGEQWGEKGYIKIMRGSNICGIENMLMWPLLDTAL